MIIEFAGISGAGKTTAFRSFLRAARDIGLPVTKFHKTARFDPLSQKAADRLFDQAYPGLKHDLERLGPDGNYELANAPRARRVWVCGTKHLKDGVVGMVDEGFFHRTAYIAAAAGRRGAFLNMLDRLPKPDVLVLVTLPVRIARKRYIERMPTPERRDRAAAIFDARAADHHTAMGLMQEALETYRRRGIETRVMDNTVPMDETLAAFAGDIAASVAAAPAAASRKRAAA